MDFLIVFLTRMLIGLVGIIVFLFVVMFLVFIIDLLVNGPDEDD